MIGYRFLAPAEDDPKIWYEANRISGNDLFVAVAVTMIASLVLLTFAQGWKSQHVVITPLAVMVFSLSGVALHGYMVLRRM